MRTELHPHEVRRLVLQVFETYDVKILRPTDLDETILIDEGHCSARTYRAGGLMAMWLIEIGILQFYDADGEMLMTVNLFEELEPQRMAA